MIHYDKFIPTFNQSLNMELSLHFEDKCDLPSLVSKIHYRLVSSALESFTFDEIIDNTGACKSSFSNQINYLLNERRIFLFKENKRKRHFNKNEVYIANTLEPYYHKIQNEIVMLSKILENKTD